MKIHNPAIKQTKSHNLIIAISSRIHSQWKKQKILEQIRATKPLSSLSHQHLPKIGKLTKFWEFSMMLCMEKRKLGNQVIIFLQNTRNTGGWEKLVKPRKRTEPTLQEVCREPLRSHKDHSPRGSLKREEQTFQPENWHGLRHCTKSQGKEQSKYSDCTLPYPSSLPFVIPPG